MQANVQQPNNAQLSQNVGEIFNLTEFTAGLTPAFRDLATDETHIAMLPGGEFADEHVFDCLPIEWVEKWDKNGYAISLIPTVIAGFLRAGRFYTLPEIMRMPLDA